MDLFPEVSPFLFEVLNNPNLYEIVIIRDVLMIIL